MNDITQVDNINVGSNLDFEKKWWHIERAAWLIMTVLVFAGLLGWFGRGQLAEQTAVSASETYQVRFERFLRFRTPSVMELTTFGNVSSADGVVTITLTSDRLAGLQIKQTTPHAVVEEPVQNGVRYSFRFIASGTPAKILFALEPGTVGAVNMQVAVNDYAPVQLSQFIYP